MKPYPFFTLCFFIILVTVPRGSRAEPVERFRYLPAGQGNNLVLQFRILHNGELRPLIPPAVPTIGSVYTVVVAPNKRSVYVPEGDYFGVNQYHVRPNGTLVPMKPRDVQADAHPTDIVFDRIGRHAYVSCSHGCVCQYAVAKDGSLSPLPIFEVFISDGGVRDPSPVFFSRNGRRADVIGVGPDKDPIIFIYRVNSEGELIFLTKRPTVSSGDWME
jgi:6-phosphogluconolactonase (cycloisomerase 2 family)